MKTVLLIGNAALSESPYISSYIEFFEKRGIPFDFVFWNRHHDNTNKLPPNYLSYNHYINNTYPNWKKIFKLNGFSRFAKKCMKRKEYSFIVVFTISLAEFVYSALEKYYKGRYVFDIRDYSPMCKIGVFYRTLGKIIENSSFTVVSSEGFLRWLPKGKMYRYVVTHNTTKEMIEKYYDFNLSSFQPRSNEVVSILTIGQIRDFYANSLLMNRLKNLPNIKMVFSGSGLASDALKEYAEQHQIENAVFTGRYQKADEESIVMSHHFINVYFSRDINSDTLMSNRFYLSVLMRKPLIANKGSFQADLIMQYGLGVVLDEKDVFPEKIETWLQNFDVEKYNRGCKAFLEKVRFDVEKFEQEIYMLYKRDLFMPNNYHCTL